MFSLEIHLRNLLKDRLIIEMNYLNGGVKRDKSGPKAKN